MKSLDRPDRKPTKKYYSAEETLTVLLYNMRKLKYRPTDGEAALLYRVLYEYYNPLASLWFITGGMAGFLVTSRWTSVPRRAFAISAFALYALEVSWLHLDSRPASSFFRDVQGQNGQIGEMMRRGDMPFRIVPTKPKPPLWRSVLDFITLDNTLYYVWHNQLRVMHEKAHAGLWLLLVDFKWSGIPAQNVIMNIYWTSIRSAIHGRLKEGTVSIGGRRE